VHLLHHRFAYIAFDCATVAAWDFPGGDAPLDRTITVPRCASPGRHVLQLFGPFVGPGDAYVAFDVNDEELRKKATGKIIGANGLPEEPPCAGDCNGDGRVSVAELVTGVGIALRSIPLGACFSFDTDGLGAVSVDELTLGAAAALRGCSFTGCSEQ